MHASTQHQDSTVLNFNRACKSNQQQLFSAMQCSSNKQIAQPKTLTVTKCHRCSLIVTLPHSSSAYNPAMSAPALNPRKLECLHECTQKLECMPETVAFQKQRHRLRGVIRQVLKRHSAPAKACSIGTMEMPAASSQTCSPLSSAHNTSSISADSDE